jgi:DNA processing protein
MTIETTTKETPVTILGLPEATVAPLIRALVPRPDELDRDAVADRFARAAWTAIAEPGDRDAGHAVAALGAEAALAALMAVPWPQAGAPDDFDAEPLEAALAAAGADPVRVEIADAVKRWRPRVASTAALLALRQAARFGATLLVPGDDDWPVGVDELGDHAPHALWARGDRAILGRLERSIALVGARAATGYGEHVTIEAASGLADRGFTIVSGAAYGIDGIAHRAALASSGPTVAFLAGGVDRFYPAGHEALLTRIVERGVVVSEVPPGTAPTQWRFLQRNRLIAAASSATVVVEAGWRSGSLNTAGHAATLGRPIGAVPGPVTSAASAGCHRMLREMPAVCVTNADEMAELVPQARTTPGAEAPTGDRGTSRVYPISESIDPTGTRVRLLDALSERAGRSVDRIAALSGLAADRVRAELGLLELEGLAHERPAGWLKFSAVQLTQREQQRR